MIVHRSLPSNKNIDSLKFRLSLAQGLLEEYSSGVLYIVRGHPIALPHIPSTGKKANLKKKMGDVHEIQEKERIYLLV
jgi:hypothetical protein